MRVHGRIDPATGAYTPYERPAPEPDRAAVDPETAAHEARHAATALVKGIRVVEATANWPSADVAGHVLYAGDTDPRDKALVRLAGEMGQPGWPPDWPSRSGPPGCDEYRLAELVDELGLDRRGYAALCAEAKNLVASPGVDQLKEMLELFLAKGHVLTEVQLATFHDALCPPQTAMRSKFQRAEGTLRTKSFVTATDADPAGEFQALVAVFNNVDWAGDRIMPGAFTKTLAAWRTSGDPVPVIWSHDWKSPDAHIGVAYAKDMKETPRGLLVKGRLDIGDNPLARRVHKLMARRSVKEFSFGYTVPPGGQRLAADGANEVIEIDLHEVGPTLKGANPATELHSVKALAADEREPVDSWDLMSMLIDRDSAKASNPGTLEDRLGREEQRRLRREWDRLQLELALEGIG